MKHIWLCGAVLGFLAAGPAFGQQPASRAADTLSLNNGKIVDGVYSNECLGLSLPIPAGWELDTTVVGPDGKARHIAGGGLTLLFLRPQGNPSALDNIQVRALDATDKSGSVQDYVSEIAHQQAVSIRLHDGTLIQKELIRDASPVEYGGRHFFRAEFKQTGPPSTIYVGFVYTKFRGYYIGENFVAPTPEEMEKIADSLLGISFREDERNSQCVEDPSPPLRVRVSQKVSQVLLIKRVQPQCPDDARQAHIQGLVVLKAEIDTNGNIEDLTLVSGHPLLAPAALEAVRQWKYKPYLLNGEPMKVETQVSVSFELTPK